MSLVQDVGWPLVALAAILAASFWFGVLSLTSSLYTAVGIGLITVGVAIMLKPGGQAGLGVFVLGTGLILWLGGDALPSMTIAEGLNFVGVGQ